MSGVRVSYSEAEARKAIAESLSWAEALRRLDRCPTGGAWRVLKKHAARWGIPTDHFLPGGRPAGPKRPLEELLVEGSPIRGTKIKERLYAAGLKQRQCERCGIGEDWHGARMSLILDHINGVRDDNRLENLRIVCPNCNATLDTHCGRNAVKRREPRSCENCGEQYEPRFDKQRFCSRYCGSRHGNRQRAVTARRPPLDELVAAVTSIGYEAVGRRHGVSGNAIRKWIRSYGAEPPPGAGRNLAHPHRVLDDEAARNALGLLAQGTPSLAVARELGVGRHAIDDLRHGRTYRHLERPQGLPRAA